MRLGPKSIIILELLAATGAGILDWSVAPTRALRDSGGYDNEQELLRQLARMDKGGWIEWRRPEDRGTWVVRLTQKGVSALTQDLDPQTAWNEEWNGEWHLVAFDLPSPARSLRRELDLWLRKRRYGRLQGSVWIAPRFSADWLVELNEMKIKPGEVSFMTGRSSAISSDADFAAGAWDFQYINQCYRLHLRHLKERGRLISASWIETEMKLWRRAYESDPFLPNELLPKDYLGKEALLRRSELYRTIGRPSQPQL